LIKLDQCQFVFNKDLAPSEDEIVSEDEDEDFADFEDFGEILDHFADKSTRNLKNSDVQRLICSLILGGNAKIRKNPDIIGDYTSRMVEFWEWWLMNFDTSENAN